MTKIKPNLLVPVDFKIYSLKAINHALKLQKEINIRIHLIHVIESQSWWADLFNSDELKRNAQQKLQALKEEQSLPENTVIKVLEGKAKNEICRYATEIKARYIVMADNYPLASGSKRLGSTLSQVIMKAEQPVISITNQEDRIFKNIAVPLDLNRSSRMQLYNSVAMALNHNAKIHLVSVLFGKNELKLNRITQKIDKYKKTYEENGVDYKVELLVKEENMAYKSLLNYCQKNDIDTILIMTHKESATFDNYLGAFAQHIINEATMPVVSINNASAHYWEKNLGDPEETSFGIFSI
jgi:nucleotide-binding universal stress UspA family protein